MRYWRWVVGAVIVLSHGNLSDPLAATSPVATEYRAIGLAGLASQPSQPIMRRRAWTA